MIYVITRMSILNTYFVFAWSRKPADKFYVPNSPLTNKIIYTEAPRAVLSDTVFEVFLRIPYDMQLKHVLADRKKRLNVGVVLTFA